MVLGIAGISLRNGAAHRTVPKGFGTPRAEAARVHRAPRTIVFALACSGALVLAARLVPPGNAPRVRDGYAFSGDAPRTLALYDGAWNLRAVLPRAGRNAVVPVRPVSRFPRGIDRVGIGRVLLLGDCREWVHLVEGVPVACAED